MRYFSGLLIEVGTADYTGHLHKIEKGKRKRLRISTIYSLGFFSQVPIYNYAEKILFQLLSTTIRSKSLKATYLWVIPHCHLIYDKDHVEVEP